jgi:ABC-type multidrug transport system fused ATPase/permease subunit
VFACTFVAIVTILSFIFFKICAHRRTAFANKLHSKHLGICSAYMQLRQAATKTQSSVGLLQGLTESIRYKRGVSIQFQKLTLQLRTTGEKLIDGVSGSFSAGSLVAVMGPSGSGPFCF